MPTLTQFLSAFTTEWQHRLETDPLAAMETHDPGVKAMWNRYLLDPGQVLNAVLSRLDPGGARLSYRKEYRRFDAAYLDGAESPPREIVLFENEMNDPDREVRKLAAANAPLKVLIIYDWSEGSKTTELRRKYVEERVRLYQELLAAKSLAQGELREENLILVGSKELRGQPLQWRWVELPDGMQHPLLSL